MIKNFIFCAALVAIISLPAAAETEPKYQNISRQLVAEANIAMNADHATDAQLLFERALTADPANTEALLGLGRSHEAQGQVGRGLKYYRLALEIEPNDQVALEAQAVAFLKREMLDRADANREKLVRLCPSGCKALDSVESALEAYLAAVKPEKTETPEMPNTKKNEG